MALCEQYSDFGESNIPDVDDTGNHESWIQVPVVQTLTVLSDEENRTQSELNADIGETHHSSSVVSLFEKSGAALRDGILKRNPENGGSSVDGCVDMLVNDACHDPNAARKRVGRPVTSPRTMAQNFPPISEIKEKLETAECYCRTRSSNSSSEVWSIFEEVAYSSNDEFTGIVRCKLCLFMTRYHGQITGTSHMRRHTCFVASYPGATVRPQQKNEANKSKNSSGGNLLSPSVKKRKNDPFSLSFDNSATFPVNIYERYNEVRDAITQEPISYVSCKSCRVLVKRETQSINGHLCRQKDLERQSCKQTSINTLLFRSKPKNRATPIWDDFEEVIDPSTNTVLGYVRCKRCRDIIKASDPKSIPAVLRRHQPNCPYMGISSPSLMITPIKSEFKSDSSSSPTNDSTPTSNSGLVTITPIQTSTTTTTTTTASGPPKVINAKAEFRERVIQFCYNELVSLETVTSESFKRLAQSLMSLGAQYGRSTLVLPDTSHLYSQMHNYYSNLKSQLKTDLNIELNRNIGGALVCDSQDDLCILSAYYINSNWQLIESVLSATTCGSDINSFITTALNDYGLNEEEKLTKFTFVSRGGLFDGVNICLTSVAHTIDQTIESTVFADDTYTDIIENCRLICNELKLKVIPEEPVETVDWIMKFEVMKSVLVNQDKFELKNAALDLDLVKAMVNLLAPFRDASVELRRCSKHPTLNHVLLWYHKLMKVLAIAPEEVETEQSFTAAMKTHIKSGMEQNFHLHSLHKIAAFLWPNFRFLKMLTPDERDTVHLEVRSFIDSRVSGDEEYGNPAKKARPDFSDWEDITDSEQDEVDKYISAMLTSCNEQNILQWWREHQNDFPKLSHLAKWILSIPASVTLLEKHRLSSTQKIDEELLFLHCNA
ncbi:hypothetical protein B4U79_01801 [Dinothrombium tinctorium]|uniref:BED-type domain-containing protein n=1 Tax=Dinothrombium tinctorium TaxID=1965070 RepID=A0A3S3PVM1_9ACAR|nr:hypothetical protein B4U79_01801 [Dinothrombium tinctorium]